MRNGFDGKATTALKEHHFIPIKGANPATFRVKCRDCEKTWEIKFPHAKFLPIGVVLKKARREGWLISSKHKPRCPKHSVEPKQYRTIVMREEPPAPVFRPMSAPLPILPSILEAAVKESVMSIEELSPASNARTKLKVINLIQGNFDEAIHRYHAGWSDERVAKDAGGLDITYVAKIRVEFFGQLAEDPAVKELQDELAMLVLESEEQLKKAKALADKVENFIRARKFGG